MVLQWYYNCPAPINNSIVRILQMLRCIDNDITNILQLPRSIDNGITYILHSEPIDNSITGILQMPKSINNGIMDMYNCLDVLTMTLQ